MTTTTQIKILKSLLLAAALVLAHLPWLGNLAEDYTEQGIKRALVTYAVTRSLNGIISVAQGTEVAVSPAGVGVTFTPGEILDPINDLVERFSWVVLASGTSLGIQRLLLEMTSTPMLTWLLTSVIAVSLLLLWFYKPLQQEKRTWGLHFNRFLVLLILLRFSIPLIALINEALYMGYMQPRYEQAQQQLEQASGQIREISEATQPESVSLEDQGLLEKAEQWFSKTRQTLDIDKQMDSLKQSAEDVSQQIINMLVVFIVQTIIFPLFFLWLIIRSGRYLMRQFEV